jgi:hypothetical protein
VDTQDRFAIIPARLKLDGINSGYDSRSRREQCRGVSTMALLTGRPWIEDRVSPVYNQDDDDDLDDDADDDDDLDDDDLDDDADDDDDIDDDEDD